VSAESAVTVVCHGTPALRRQWFGELARLLASAPSPAAALLEESLGSSLMRATVRPAGLVRTLGASLAGASVRIEEVAPRAPAPPPAFGCDCIGYLARVAEVRDRPPVPVRGGIDRIGIAPTLQPGMWLGLQTLWVPARRGTLWLARRFRVTTRSRAELDRRLPSVGTAVAAEWTLRLGLASTFQLGGRGCGRDWRNGGTRTVPKLGWFERPPGLAARSVDSLEPAGLGAAERPVETPAIVLGASGAGKTTYLARWAAGVMNRGESLFAVDLHGDLAPEILARVSPGARPRVVAIDATLRPVPGVAVLASVGSRDRAAAHLVAALKRLTPDGNDLYWGFRLERIFDSFVRVALESGGSLTDLYDLLTNPDRRDSARLSTRSTELARFLEELAPVVRRNPEFLWSAATRLSKVVLVPALRELLSPEEGGLPVEALLAGGRSLLVRLPFASLGPEAAAFAATLVLGRVYLGIAADSDRRGPARPVSLVLDEVHAFSPRLVAEILTEGRKFGLRTIVATQYPDRLARELQSAARGALRGFVAFRVARPSAVEVGTWLGLDPIDAARILPNLPTGQGLALDPHSEDVRPTTPEPPRGPINPRLWTEAVGSTRREFPVANVPDREGRDGDLAAERVLLAVLSMEESGRAVGRDTVVAEAVSLPGPGPDPALLFDRLAPLVREGFLSEVDGALHLTPAGERRLGLTAPTEATRETAEHRALLMAAFRLFARRGYRLDILRQGRFDTTLPDARFRQLAGRSDVSVPVDLAGAIEQARRGWAWRFFGGRDVFVEAEVSGALRSERIRHGVRKALHRGAFVLFVVGDARRARRVRTVIRSVGLGADRAQVWTLPLAGRSADATRRTNP